MRFSDRTTRNVQKRLEAPQNNEHAFIPLLHAMIRELWRPGMAVRLVGVSVTGFNEERVVQESLFDVSQFDTSEDANASDSSNPLFDEGEISGSAESGAKPKPVLSKGADDQSN